MNSCVYFGCKDDLAPIQKFNEINEWIYIETLPHNKGGDKILVNLNDVHDEIIREWIRTFNNAGFYFITDEDSCLLFRSETGKTIHFFYNFSFCYVSTKLKNLLKRTNTIYSTDIIELPECEIIDYMKLPIQYISSSF